MRRERERGIGARGVIYKRRSMFKASLLTLVPTIPGGIADDLAENFAIGTNTKGRKPGCQLISFIPKLTEPLMVHSKGNARCKCSSLPAMHNRYKSLMMKWDRAILPVMFVRPTSRVLIPSPEKSLRLTPLP